MTGPKECEEKKLHEEAQEHQIKLREVAPNHRIQLKDFEIKLQEVANDNYREN